MDNKLLLIGGFLGEEVELIKGYSDVEILTICDEDTDCVVKEFIDKGSSGVSPIDLRVILLHNFQREEIFNFINFYKSLKLPKPIFAMITEHSINWKIKDLLFQLVQEEREVRGRG